MRPSRVWYLAYGSNLNAARFGKYLQGGETEPGARDSSEPIRDAWAKVPMRLVFARTSHRWNGGGVAFLAPPEPADFGPSHSGDSDGSGTCWVRAWDITAEQFEDIFAQENRLPVGSPLPWHELLTSGAVDFGHGWYRRILALTVDALGSSQPAFTFTAATPAPFNPPNAEYRATIAAGLADNPALDGDMIASYLLATTLIG